MFKMPTVERTQLIMDMVPEMVAVFTQKGKGYNVRISQLGELSRLRGLCKEVGIEFSLPFKSLADIVKTLGASEVPDFAFVISKIGRYHIAFAGEDTPAVQLTREFGDQCIDGSVFLYQKGVSTRDDKRLFASGAYSYYHLNSECSMLFHS
jgi:hypothetical protein